MHIDLRADDVDALGDFCKRIIVLQIPRKQRFHTIHTAFHLMLPPPATRYVLPVDRRAAADIDFMGHLSWRLYNIVRRSTGSS